MKQSFDFHLNFLIAGVYILSDGISNDDIRSVTE